MEKVLCGKEMVPIIGNIAIDKFQTCYRNFNFH